MDHQQVTVANLIESLAARWPSAWVARTDVRDFSGGLISEKYIANLDSSGDGPEGRFRVGRKICYPVSSLCSWLQARSEIVKKKPMESFPGLKRKVNSGRSEQPK